MPLCPCSCPDPGQSPCWTESSGRILVATTWHDRAVPVGTLLPSVGSAGCGAICIRTPGRTRLQHRGCSIPCSGWRGPPAGGWRNYSGLGPGDAKYAKVAWRMRELATARRLLERLHEGERPLPVRSEFAIPPAQTDLKAARVPGGASAR